MASFLSLIGSFISGLFALEVPGIGISYGTLMLGLWFLIIVFWLVKKIISGGDD